MTTRKSERAIAPHSLRNFGTFSPSPSRYSEDEEQLPVTVESLSRSFFKDIRRLGDTGKLGYDVQTIMGLLKVQYLDGGITDDKEYLMERLIQLASSLPSDSVDGSQLTRSLLDKLWNTLQHPPLSYVSNRFQYRTADGSFNNIMSPNLGMSNTPYARSVRPTRKLPGAPPDPGLIFDTLFARGEKIREHPNKISSFLFYLASIIIHDLFRTSHEDPAISKTSSYLDLSPLYGSTDEEQQRVRTFQDGKLKPDAFSERRLLGFPPGVSALLITFNRFHNYIVDMLAKVNQSNLFSGPYINEKARDEKLFQTGRLITCGLYINIVLIDYIRVILNLNRTNTSWVLDPRLEIHKIFSESGTPQGIGNQVALEFNMIYRWHCAISEKDAKWTEDFYSKVFGKTHIDVTMRDFMVGVDRWEKSIPEDPGARTFNGLKRGEDGRFNDDDLVNIICDGVEDVAGAFGARNIPVVMKLIEVLGIQQSRSWQVASLNEFRAFFGLKEYKTFEEINSDKDVAEALRQLYEDPNNVELYPGLVAEEAKKTMVPGSGLCPGFTVSRAILSDAVALVRGDRFYTIDYNSGNLTNFGMTEVSPNTHVAFGTVIHKLFQTAYPNSFEFNSVYSTYPFTVPSENKKIFTELGVVDDYVYTRPKGTPKKTAEITSRSTISKILNSKDTEAIWQSRAAGISGQQNAGQGDLLDFIVEKKDFNEQVKTFFSEHTREFIREKAGKLGGGYFLDAVRDVGNLVGVYFMANLFHLPLQTGHGDHREGIYSGHDLQTVLSVIAAYIFRDSHVQHSRLLELREAASAFWNDLIKIEGEEVYGRHKLLRKHDVVSSIGRIGKEILAKLFDDEHEDNKVLGDVLILAARTATGIGRSFAQILEFYLQPENAKLLENIQESAIKDDDQTIEKYVLEGMRLRPEVEGYKLRVNDPETLSEVQGLQAGDMVYLNVAAANMDENVYPSPSSVDLNRKSEDYLHLPRTGSEYATRVIALTAMLKEFACLKGLKPAPGPQGQLKFITLQSNNSTYTHKAYLDEDWSTVALNPTTMKVQFASFE